MLGMKQAGSGTLMPDGTVQEQGKPPLDDPAHADGNVTPQEQQAYDMFVRNGMEIIFPGSGGVAPSVLAHLKGEFDDVAEIFANADPPLTPSPTDNLAVAATAIVLALEASASQANAEITDDIVYHGGVEIIEQLTEVAEAAKLHDYSEQDQENALYRAVDLYRVSSGRVDQEGLKAEFGQFVEADKQGPEALEQMAPGIGERIKQQQGG